MRSWTLALLGAPLALARPNVQSSSKCNDEASVAAVTKASGSYPTGAPYEVSYGTSTSTTTSTKTVTVKPSKGAGSKPTKAADDTFSTAFPTHVFPPGSIPTLQPAIPAHYDSDNLDCLNPKKAGPGVPLHYAQQSKSGSYEEGTFAVVVPKFKMPSVVLDYANSAKKVEMVRGGDLVITFADHQAYQRSLSAWKSLKEVIFVTFTPNCGDYEEGERCYFLATKLNFDEGSLTCRAGGKARDVRDLAETIEVSWGSYNDQTLNGAPGVSGGSYANSPTATGGKPASYSYPSATRSISGSYPTISPSTNGTNTSTIDVGSSGDGCQAPADSKYGLPTSCPGPHFDDNLDTGLGYKTSKDFSWNEWVMDVSLEDPYAEPTIVFDDPVQTRSLDKRNLGQKLKQKFKDIVAPDGTSIRDKKTGKLLKDLPRIPGVHLIQPIIKGTVAVGKFVGNVITGQPNVLEKEFTKLFLPPKLDEGECTKDKKKCALEAKSAKAVKTPWDDDGILLYSFGTAPAESELIKGRKTKTTVKGKFLNIYCVKCGLHGSAKITGRLTIKGTEVTEGTIEADLSVKVGVGLGAYAQLIHTKEVDINLFNVPISPFTIGVLTLGPYISIGARANFGVNATGTALFRADVTFAKAHFKHDFKTKTSTQRGFKPTFDPSFEADGEIELWAAFGTPFGLKVGLSTLKGCKHCEGAVGIEDFPHLKASTKFGLQASGNKTNFEAGVKAINNCTGIYTALTAENIVTLTANGFGFAQYKYELWKMPEYTIKDWCIPIGKQPNKTEKRTISDHEYDLHNYPRDGLNETTTNGTTLNGTDATNVDLTHYIVSSIEQPQWEGPDIPNHAYSLANDGMEEYWFTTIVLAGASGPNKDYALTACNDGNVYMQTNTPKTDVEWYEVCNPLWSGYSDVILMDGNQAVLYYYKNTMEKAGVSRVRTADPEAVPDSANMVFLVPYYYDDVNTEATVLAAVDDANNVFFPVVCTYTDSQSAKIYLVRDIEAGISTLKSPDVKYSVTNGDVADCDFLPLTWGADKTATEPEWASEIGAEVEVEAEFNPELEYDEAAFADGKFVEDNDTEEDDSFFEHFDDLMFDESEYFM